MLERWSLDRRAAWSASLSQRVGAYAFLTVSVIVWGGSWRATAIAADYSTPLMLAALRALTATMVLLGVVLVTGACLPLRRLWVWVVITALLLAVFGTYGQIETVIRAGPGTGAVLAATTPFFAIIFTWLLLRQRTSLLGFAGIVAGFVGVSVVILSQLGGGEGTDPVLGAVFGLLVSAGFALGLVLIKLLAEQVEDLDLVSLTAAQLVIGSVVLVALALSIEGARDTTWSSAELWGAIVWGGPAATGLGYLAFYAAVKRLDPARAAAWIFLVPVIAVLVEVARGDSPKPISAIGMTVAIAGVAVTSIAPERPLTRALPVLPWTGGHDRARPNQKSSSS